MRRHPDDGAEIVSRIAACAGSCRSCAATTSGSTAGGYPDGLAGEAIPLLARIVAVADTFDAMTTSRPYRRGLAREVAARRDRPARRRAALPPTVVAAFERLFERGRFRSARGRAVARFLVGAVGAAEYNGCVAR